MRLIPSIPINVFRIPDDRIVTLPKAGFPLAREMSPDDPLKMARDRRLEMFLFTPARLERNPSLIVFVLLFGVHRRELFLPLHHLTREVISVRTFRKRRLLPDRWPGGRACPPLVCAARVTRL